MILIYENDIHLSYRSEALFMDLKNPFQAYPNTSWGTKSKKYKVTYHLLVVLYKFIIYFSEHKTSETRVVHVSVCPTGHWTGNIVSVHHVNRIFKEGSSLVM